MAEILDSGERREFDTGAVRDILVVDQEYENNIWQEMCKDPLYPCAKCTNCQDPKTCHTKKCGLWRNWWKFRFSQAREQLMEVKERNRRRW